MPSWWDSATPPDAMWVHPTNPDATGRDGCRGRKEPKRGQCVVRFHDARTRWSAADWRTFLKYLPQWYKGRLTTGEVPLLMTVLASRVSFARALHGVPSTA